MSSYLFVHTFVESFVINNSFAGEEIGIKRLIEKHAESFHGSTSQSEYVKILKVINFGNLKEVSSSV